LIDGIEARACLFVICDADTHGRELARLAPAIQQVLARAAPGTIALVERDRLGTDDRARLARLRVFRTLCDAHRAALIVAGRVDLALAAHADGVHLPERGLSPEAVASLLTRARAARPMAIGRSCHDRAGLLVAAAQGADWAFLSPVFAPHSKPATSPRLGLDGFAAAIAGLTLPVVALGGLLPAHVAPLMTAGARGVATLGAVLGTPDPAARASEFLVALAERLSAGPRNPQNPGGTLGG
jgi:thiamine-phosphate pyrophosphorylase